MCCPFTLCTTDDVSHLLPLLCISYGSETKSVKDPGNTIDVSPKWTRTLLFVGNDYSMKNCQRTAKFLPIWGLNKSIAQIFSWFMFLGGIMHLKLTAGCRINDFMLKSCGEMSCSGTFRTVKIATSFLHKGFKYNYMQSNVGSTLSLYI
jgi:hypothetical protein